MTYTQDQNGPAPDTEDANSSNNSLRRKLFFTHDESTEDEDEIPFILSPLKPSSPPQSGMFVHGTPLRGRSFSMQRTHGTPYSNSRNLSPLNMSPICNTNLDMSCQSVQSRRSARLDFSTFMSIDTSMNDEKDLKEAQEVPPPHPDTIFEESSESAKSSEDNKNETIEMTSFQDSSAFRPIIEISKIDRVKDTDWYRSSSESINGLKHTLGNTLIRSNFSELSTCNLAQDTGYQTYSMNSTSDSRSTPGKKQSNWCDKITAITEIEEIKGVNWEENIQNMYSSTPSKYGRRRIDG